MERTEYGHILSKLKEMTQDVPQEALDMELRMTAQTLRLIAEGKPVTPGRLAEAWGFPLEHAEQIIAGARGKLEINEDGHLVGAGGLSQRETSFRIDLDGRTLYAWCGLDALFIAGFIGERITAETHDPLTGEPITLTVGPDGLQSYAPEGLTLSVYLPGEGDAYDKAGANSIVCLNMPFFASPETAAEWLADRPSNRPLPVADAYRLARELWLDRLDVIMAQSHTD